MNTYFSYFQVLCNKLLVEATSANRTKIVRKLVVTAHIALRCALADFAFATAILQKLMYNKTLTNPSRLCLPCFGLQGK